LNILGFVTKFIGLAFYRQRKCEMFESIEITGSAEFLARTREALELLQSTPLFTEVQRHVAVIQQGRRSGMRADAKRPTFVVGKRTWSHSALWYAGAIAHDSYHSKLYHEAKAGAGGNPPADCWTGKDAEKKCLVFQIEVMLSLGADESIVAYLRELEKSPTYQDRDRGWRSWWDYLWRRW
jgi:hypothetical protein